MSRTVFEMQRKWLITLFKLLPEGLQEKILRVGICKGIVRVVVHRRFWIRRKNSRLQTPESNKRYLREDMVYWVDPKKIVYATNKGFNIYEYTGTVIGGSWDKLERKFNEIDFYISYERRAIEGRDWEELPYYRRVLSQIDAGTPMWECHSKKELDKRCKRLDKIFKSIKRNGYRSQLYLGKGQGKDRLLDVRNEVTVNIGRYGDLLFNNGRHRLTFAKLCGIENIPIEITVRHIEWAAFKKEIELYAEKHNGRVYAPLTHIDLRSIPSHYSDERFEIIKSNMGKRSSTLLDIGAHWGYFCHKFEEEGFHCTAVEYGKESLYFLRKLKRAENSMFTVASTSVFNLVRGDRLKYDVVLALAVFHHFLKEESAFGKLKLLLNALHVNEMYFEPNLQSEPQMRGAFMNFSPEEFVDFILNNSCLNEQKLIGKCEDGRPIYRLWK